MLLNTEWSICPTSVPFAPSELQAVCQRSQSLREKCKNLTSLQKKLEDESLSKETQRFSSLREMLTVHQVQLPFQILYISFIQR